MAAKNLRSKSAPQLTRSGLRSSSAATVISDKTKERIANELYGFSDEMYDNESRGLAPLFTRQKTIERDLDPFSSMDDDIPLRQISPGMQLRRPSGDPPVSLKQISVEKNKKKLQNLDSLYAKEKSKKISKGGKKKRRKTRRRKRTRRRRGGNKKKLTPKDVAKYSRNRQKKTAKNPSNKCSFLQTPVYNLNPQSFQENKLKKSLALRNALVNENCTHLLNEFTKRSNNAMMSLSSQQHGGRKRRRSRRKRSKRKRRTRRRR